MNAANTDHLETYKAFLYDRLQRKGFDRQDIHRLAARDRHVFAALMLAHGHGDGMVTGATRKSAHVLELINHVFDAGPHDGAVGVTVLLHRGRIVLDRRHAGPRMAGRERPRRHRRARRRGRARTSA